MTRQSARKIQLLKSMKVNTAKGFIGFTTVLKKIWHAGWLCSRANLNYAPDDEKK